MQKISISCTLPPGDCMVLSAAIVSLHQSYPGKYLTRVATPDADVWLNNPYIQEFDRDDDTIFWEIGYPLIQTAGNASVTFLQGFIKYMEDKLGVLIKTTTNRPHIYFTEKEKEPFRDDLPEEYIVFVSGIKNDFTTKQWPTEYYEEVVKHFKGRIEFVQAGLAAHNPNGPIDGAFNLIGQTTTRDFLRLCSNATGGLGPITFLQHAMAAFKKPCCVLVGGREDLPWCASYPLQYTFHTFGMLPCCETRACWKSRVVPLKDGMCTHRGLKLDDLACKFPIYNMNEPVAKCMEMIKPKSIIDTIEMWVKKDWVKEHIAFRP